LDGQSLKQKSPSQPEAEGGMGVCDGAEVGSWWANTN